MKKEKVEKKEKKKIKIDGRKLFSKIIALVMLVILLLGSFYSLIYILMNL